MSDVELDLLGLPARKAWDCRILSLKQKLAHTSAGKVTTPFADSLLGRTECPMAEVFSDQNTGSIESWRAKACLLKSTSVKDCLPHKMQRAILAAEEKGASSWLTALPWQISDSCFPRVTSGTLYIYVMVEPHPDYQRLVFVANLFTSTMLYPACMKGTWDSGTTRCGKCLEKYWKILVLMSASSRP